MGAGASVEGPGEEQTLQVPSLKQVPEAMETVLFVREKWPLLVDPSEQTQRFLRYQRGAFVLASSLRDASPEHLRTLLVGCLKMGSTMTLCFETLKGVDVDGIFVEGYFPRAILSKTELNKEEVWSTLLRPERGDPPVVLEISRTNFPPRPPIEFVPRDDFALCVVVREPFEAKDVPAQFHEAFVKIEVGLPLLNSPLNKAASPTNAAFSSAKSTAGGGQGDDATGATTKKKKDKQRGELEAVLHAKEEIKNSKDLVELAFDGDLDEVKALLANGFHVDSTDARRHTALSDAAQQGHMEVATYLLHHGADPNSQSDLGRTPLWRAAFNGMYAMVDLLLKAGADPAIVTTEFERPFDVAKDEATRELLATWPEAQTAKLRAQREAKIQAELDRRLRTAAEREAHAREVLRGDLVKIAHMGDANAMKAKLDEIVVACEHSGERPRVTANSARDDRGATLVHIAAQHGHIDLLALLLDHQSDRSSSNAAEARIIRRSAPSSFSLFDDKSATMQRRVYSTDVNRKDAKGWTPTVVAVFHGQKAALRMLLDHGGDPTLKNQYGHDAFSLAQDDLASDEVTVLKDKSEVRAVLLEREQHSHQRRGSTHTNTAPPKTQREALPKDGTAVAMQLEMFHDAAVEHQEHQPSRRASRSSKIPAPDVMLSQSAATLNKKGANNNTTTSKKAETHQKKATTTTTTTTKAK